MTVKKILTGLSLISALTLEGCVTFSPKSQLKYSEDIGDMCVMIYDVKFKPHLDETAGLVVEVYKNQKNWYFFDKNYDGKFDKVISPQNDMYKKDLNFVSLIAKETYSKYIKEMKEKERIDGIFASIPP